MSLILPRRRANQRMINVIKRLGLSDGLKLCLDAGDIDSYASGQKWLDQSGGGYDFHLGADSAATATDPTHTGTPGRQSSGEYWAFDGGDYFTYDSANETWMENCHKNSAIWAYACWVYVASLPAAGGMLFGNNKSNSGNIGVSAFVRTTGALRTSVGNADGLPNGALLVTSTATVNTNAWNFLAGQISEAAGTGYLQVNGTQEDQTTTYTTPSALAASFVTQVATDGGGGGTAGPIPSGYRMGSFVMWEGSAPTKAQALSYYNATRGKYGL